MPEYRVRRVVHPTAHGKRLSVERFWQGVGIHSANKNNRLEHVTLEYAGSKNLFTFVNGTAGLQLKGGTSVTLVQDSIRNNANYGVSAQAGVDLSGFSSNVIMDNEKMSMNIAATNMGALDEKSFFKTAVRVNTGRISDFLEIEKLSPLGTPVSEGRTAGRMLKPSYVRSTRAKAQNVRQPTS